MNKVFSILFICCLLITSCSEPSFDNNPNRFISKPGKFTLVFPEGWINTAVNSNKIATCYVSRTNPDKTMGIVVTSTNTPIKNPAQQMKFETNFLKSLSTYKPAVVQSVTIDGNQATKVTLSAINPSTSIPGTTISYIIFKNNRSFSINCNFNYEDLAKNEPICTNVMSSFEFF
ncbi:MAG: hypothetical protein AB1782_14960 [Cyanobacteriota bacterium]